MHQTPRSGTAFFIWLHLPLAMEVEIWAHKRIMTV
jgi:hypothetical protein